MHKHEAARRSVLTWLRDDWKNVLTFREIAFVVRRRPSLLARFVAFEVAGAVITLLVVMVTGQVRNYSTWVMVPGMFIAGNFGMTVRRTLQTMQLSGSDALRLARSGDPA